jgi:hypothetical protein
VIEIAIGALRRDVPKMKGLPSGAVATLARVANGKGLRGTKAKSALAWTERSTSLASPAPKIMQEFGHRPQRWNQPEVWRRADPSLAPPSAVLFHSTTWIIRLLRLPFPHQLNEFRVDIIWKDYL